MPDLYVSEIKKETKEPVSKVAETKKTEAIEKEKDAKGDETITETRRLISEVLERAGEIPRKAVQGAYQVRPGGRFINEQADEETVLLLRAHPIVNIKWLAAAILAVIFPEMLNLTGMFAGVPLRFIFVGRLFIYLALLGFCFEKFLSWWYSVLIITNERIVDIDFVNLLYRVVSYATLNHIEEPRVVAGGFIRSLFKYGDLFVATAAEESTIEGRAIPYPDKVIKIISELSEELEKRRERGE